MNTNELIDFVRSAGSFLYGKECWFYEQGKWYSRKSHQYISTKEMFDEMLEMIKEYTDD